MFKNQSHFLNILIIIPMILLTTNSNMIASLPITNFSCNQQFLYYQQMIPITTTENFIIIDSSIKDNQGDVIVKIFPIRESTKSSQIPNFRDIINEMRKKETFKYTDSNFTAKILSNYEQYLDMQGLFTYSNRSIIKIKNNQIGSQIKSIFIIFYRKNFNKFDNQNDLFPCTDNVISYTVWSSNEKICPQCFTNNTLLFSTCSQQGHCICKNDYIGKSCQLAIKKLYLRTDNQKAAYPDSNPYHFTSEPLSRKHFYFNQFTQKTMKIIFQSPAGIIKILTSKQILSDQMPYITTANTYNHKLYNPFTLEKNQNFLITIANMENITISYTLKIQEISEVPAIMSIILITIGSLLFAMVCCLVVCYLFFTFYKIKTYKHKVCDDSEYPEQLFPTIRFYEFRMYILQFTIPNQYKYSLFNKSQSDICSYAKNNIQDCMEQVHKQNVCAICLQQITDESLIKYTFCNHIHDAKCLDQWMNRQLNCPLCRQSFDLISVFKWRKKIRDTIQIIIDQQSQNSQVKSCFNRELQFNDTINYFTDTQKKDYVLDTIKKRKKRETSNQNANNLYQINEQTNSKFNKNSLSSAQNQPSFRKKNNSQPVNIHLDNYNFIQLSLSLDRKTLPLQDQGIDQKIYKYYKSIWLYHKKQRIDSTLRKNQRTSIFGLPTYQETFIQGQPEQQQQMATNNCLNIKKKKRRIHGQNQQIRDWNQEFYNYELQHNIDFSQQN